MMSVVAQTCPGPHALPLLSARLRGVTSLPQKASDRDDHGQAIELRVGWEQEARCHYMIFIYLIQIGLALTMESRLALNAC